MLIPWSIDSYKSRNFLYIAGAFLLLTVSSCKTAYSTSDQNSDMESIKIVLSNQEKAWNRGDIDAFMLGYLKSEELSFIRSKGVTKGWNATLANYKKGYPDKATMGILHFDIIELKTLSPQVAYMIRKYTLTREADMPSGYFNLLWRKIDGQWVICSDHTSS